MPPAGLSLDARQEALDRFIEKYLRRGFKLNSHGPTTAELYRAPRFPLWLFPEQTIFVDIDERGRIYIVKA